MKKTTILFNLALLLTFNVIAADFTTGNLVVLRVGNGDAALTSAGTPSFLEEITTTGTAVQTIANPTSGDNMISNSGTATSEGALSLSPDGTYITFAGYNATTGTTSVGGTASATTNRIILSYDKKLNITSIKSTTAFSANNIRSAVRNGSDFWAGGTSSVAGTNGVQYFGTSTAAQVSSTVTNVRVVNIFNNQLYFSTGSSPIGIYKVGTGLPTTTGQTSTLEITVGGTSPSPYGFTFNTTNTICYVADDRANASGSVKKYTNSGSGWTEAYTLNPATNIGTRGLTVDWSGVNPIIYAVGTDSKVYKIEDVNASSAGVVLATAPTNTAFRGIAFAPKQNPSTNVISPKSNNFTHSNNTLTFTELPTSKIEVYTLTGSKAAIYEPAQSIKLELSKGVYVLKVDNRTSKIMVK